MIEGSDPALRNEYITIESHLDGAVGIARRSTAIASTTPPTTTPPAAPRMLAIAEQMMTGAAAEAVADLHLGQRRGAGAVGHATVRAPAAGAARRRSWRTSTST